MSTSHHIIERGRDAGNGQFIPLAEAKRRKKTAIIDRMKAHKKPPKKRK
jgi:hypothetical protein